MDSILKQRFPNLAVITALALSVWSLDGLTSTVEAQQFSTAQLQQVNSGLFRSSSQDFFEEGERRLEREIKLLTHRRLTPAEDLLKVPTKSRIEADIVNNSTPPLPGRRELEKQP